MATDSGAINATRFCNFRRQRRARSVRGQIINTTVAESAYRLCTCLLCRALDAMASRSREIISQNWRRRGKRRRLLEKRRLRFQNFILQSVTLFFSFSAGYSQRVGSMSFDLWRLITFARGRFFVNDCVVISNVGQLNGALYCADVRLKMSFFPPGYSDS